MPKLGNACWLWQVETTGGEDMKGLGISLRERWGKSIFLGFYAAQVTQPSAAAVP